MKGTIERRIERGAKWLDTQKPGWHETVQIECLKSVRGSHCMANLALRQRGAWEKAMTPLHGPTHFGFNAGTLDEDRATVDAWRQLVAQRRDGLPCRHKVPSGLVALVAMLTPWAMLMP